MIDNHERNDDAPELTHPAPTLTDSYGDVAPRMPRRTPPHGRPFTSQSAREAAFRRHERERERKAERERAAEWDQLTVQGRYAKALAMAATSEDLLAVIRALIAKAKEGNVPAAKVVLQALTEVLPESPDEVSEGTRWEDMTTEQRAAYRAQLERFIAMQESGEDEQAEGEDRSSPSL